MLEFFFSFVDTLHTLKMTNKQEILYTTKRQNHFEVQYCLNRSNDRLAFDSFVTDTEIANYLYRESGPKWIEVRKKLFKTSGKKSDSDF